MHRFLPFFPFCKPPISDDSSDEDTDSEEPELRDIHPSDVESETTTVSFPVYLKEARKGSTSSRKSSVTTTSQRDHNSGKSSVTFSEKKEFEGSASRRESATSKRSALTQLNGLPSRVVMSQDPLKGGGTPEEIELEQQRRVSRTESERSAASTRSHRSQRSTGFNNTPTPKGSRNSGFLTEVPEERPLETHSLVDRRGVSVEADALSFGSQQVRWIKTQQKQRASTPIGLPTGPRYISRELRRASIAEMELEAEGRTSRSSIGSANTLTASETNLPPEPQHPTMVDERDVEEVDGMMYMRGMRFRPADVDSVAGHSVMTTHTPEPSGVSHTSEPSDQYIVDAEDETITNPVMQVRFRYEFPTSQMNVEVVQVKNLPLASRSYQVHLAILPSKKVMKRTAFRSGPIPKYDESITFTLNPADFSPAEDIPDQFMRFRVYMRSGLLGQQLVGGAIIPLVQVNIQRETTKWVLLGDEEDTNSVEPEDEEQEPHSTGQPELSVGLMYSQLTGRLTVELVRAINMTVANTLRPELYVKLLLLSGSGDEMAKSRSVIKRGTAPTFNETFIFQVAQFQLDQVTLMLSIYTKKKDMVGWVALGATNTSQEEHEHWQLMKEAKFSAIYRWHILYNQQS